MSIENVPAYVASEVQKSDVLGFIAEAGHSVQYTSPDQIRKGDGAAGGIPIEFKFESLEHPDSICITNDQLEGFDPKGFIVCSRRRPDGHADLENTLAFTSRFVREYLAIASGYRERHQWTGKDGKKFRVFEFTKQAHNAYDLKTFRNIL
jgi:hypothetical protein